MKITLLSLSTLLLFQFSIKAQHIEWIKTIGSSGVDRGFSITLDSFGNIYTTGQFQNTVDFDPNEGVYNITAAGDPEIFVHKIDTAGNFQWVKNMPNGNVVDFAYNLGYAIKTDKAGNVYTIGNFRGTVDFDPGEGISNLTDFGTSDFYIQKLDSQGNLRWVTSIGDIFRDYGFAIAIDDSSNVYTTGMYRGTIDLDPGEGITEPIPGGTTGKCFVQKLDSMGNFVWAKSMGSSSNGSNSGRSIAVDNQGNVYVSGDFERTADFDPNSEVDVPVDSEGSWDYFIKKLNINGELLWAKTIGGVDIDRVSSMVLDGFGNIYITGYFSDTVDFDPNEGVYNLTSNGYNDIFIQKLDANGNFIWAKSTGGINYESGDYLTTDEAGNCYILGEFSDIIDFNPGDATYYLSPFGEKDIFIQKLNPDGEFCWAKNIGRILSFYGGRSAIEIDHLNNMYILGSFDSILGFSSCRDTTNIVGGGMVDIFILKLSQNVELTNIDYINACDTYTWTDGNTYTTSNDTALDTLIGINGCDSIVRLNLIINTVDASVSITDQSVTANAIDATYQWLDCSNDNAPIIGATTQTFTPVESGVYAVEVTQNDCIAISECVPIMLVNTSETLLGKTLNIFPNPSNGLFTINLPKNTQKGIVKLIDYSGKPVYNQQLAGIKTALNLSHLPAGVYLLTIIMDSGIVLQKKITLN